MDKLENAALVLSAGGMYGAYQAGVWEALEGIFQPELVIGASVGALNGWMIASGCPGSELTSLWVNSGELATVRWQFPRRWSDGLIDTSNLEGWIREACSIRTPIRRFGVVVTTLPKLRRELTVWPEAGWEHIAASCAVPLLLRPYRLGGSVCVDGGLVHPLPLEAAFSLGATRIVAVNVMNRRPAGVRALVRTLQVCSGYARPDCKQIEVLEIAPSERLGGYRDTMFWSADNIRRWLELGRADAQRVRGTIVEWLERAPTRIPGSDIKQCPSIESIA